MIAVPSWLLGQVFPIVGGAVIAILAGMVITLFIKDKSAFEAGGQIHFKEDPPVGGYFVGIRHESHGHSGDGTAVPADHRQHNRHIADHRLYVLHRLMHIPGGSPHW